MDRFVSLDGRRYYVLTIVCALFALLLYPPITITRAKHYHDTEVCEPGGRGAGDVGDGGFGVEEAHCEAVKNVSTPKRCEGSGSVRTSMKHKYGIRPRIAHRPGIVPLTFSLATRWQSLKFEQHRMAEK